MRLVLHCLSLAAMLLTLPGRLRRAREEHAQDAARCAPAFGAARSRKRGVAAYYRKRRR